MLYVSFESTARDLAGVHSLTFFVVQARRSGAEVDTLKKCKTGGDEYCKCWQCRSVDSLEFGMFQLEMVLLQIQLAATKQLALGRMLRSWTERLKRHIVSYQVVSCTMQLSRSSTMFAGGPCR